MMNNNKDNKHSLCRVLFIFEVMYLKNSNGRDKKQNSAINSAALQDHLLRKFNFNLEDKKPNSLAPSQTVFRRKTHDKLPSITKGIDS